jgi:hypothetical protein
MRSQILVSVLALAPVSFAFSSNIQVDLIKRSKSGTSTDDVVRQQGTLPEDNLTHVENEVENEVPGVHQQRTRNRGGRTRTDDSNKGQKRRRKGKKNDVN